MTLRIPDKYCYQPIVENLSYGIQEIDHHGVILYSDATCHQILGFTETELKGRFIWALLTSELEKGKLHSHLIDLIENNKPIMPYFTQSYTKTGHIIDVEMLWHQNINHSTPTLVTLIKNISGYRLADTEFPSIFEHAREAISLIEPYTQNLVAFNHKMVTHLGYSARALMRLKLSNFELGAVDQHIQTVLQQGYHSYETQHRCQNGVLREVLITVQIVNIKDKILIQQICHDITAHQNQYAKAQASLNQELAEARHQLAAAETELIRMRQLKDEFLASMSHELRAPLNSILGLTEALQEGIYGSVNERQLKSLQRVEMRSLSRYFDGIGLGLILVQKLTELHGGNLTVTSEMGQGSQFTLSLPWQRTPQQHDMIPILASKPSKSPLVLFVAPHEPNINWFIEYFHLQAIQIIVAHNSQQLWDYVHTQKFDMIIISIPLMEKNNLELIQNLHTVQQPLPLIVFSALTKPNDHEHYLAAGAWEYLDKPINLNTLNRIVNQYLLH